MKVKAGSVYKSTRPLPEWMTRAESAYIEYIKVISRRKINKKKVVIKKEVIQINKSGQIDIYGPTIVKESSFKSTIASGRYILTDESDLAKSMLGGNYE